MPLLSFKLFIHLLLLKYFIFKLLLKLLKLLFHFKKLCKLNLHKHNVK